MGMRAYNQNTQLILYHYISANSIYVQNNALTFFSYTLDTIPKQC
jgi:hypothetical protein